MIIDSSYYPFKYPEFSNIRYAVDTIDAGYEGFYCTPLSIALYPLMAEAESFFSWCKKTKKSANFWLDGLETMCPSLLHHS